jgi:type III restriction enzyme
LPFVRIEAWNFTTHKDGRRHFKDVISPASLIPKLSFTGFTKSCHFEYKFDSKTEKDFSQLLEADTTVLKWLRPAPNQFRIYWAHNSRQYYPDFIVETEKAIYMVETKAADQIESSEVQSKKQAALKYCQYATKYTSSIGGNPWHYLLIPHHEVTSATSFDYLANSYKV